MQDHQDPGVTYVELARFYIPLALLPFLIQASKVISNAAIARLPQPEAVFAAYSVARSLASPLLSPMWMTRQSCVALIDSAASYVTVRNVISALGASIILLLGVIAFTPLGPWLLTHLMGIEDEVILYHALWTLRIVSLLPVSEVLRNLPQAVTISLARTHAVPFGTVLRLLFTAGFLYVVVVQTLMSGAAAATIVWVGGIALEGIFLIIYLRQLYGNAAAAADRVQDRRRGALDTRQVLRFFLPLGATSALGQLVLPAINAGLARTAAPTIAIGAFAVGKELAMFLIAPVKMLHQAVIVYHGRSSRAAAAIFRFSAAVGLLFAAVIWLTVNSPAVTWLLETVIELPASMLTPAVTALAVLAIWPLIVGLREFYWGVLMERRETLIIGVARTANLLGATGMLAVGLAAPWFAPGSGLHPAALGSVAFVTGELTETVVVGLYVRRRTRAPDPARVGAPAAEPEGAPTGDRGSPAPRPHQHSAD